MQLLFARFAEFLALLRNEPSLRFPLFGAELLKLSNTFVKRTVVGSSVAEIERQVFRLIAERQIAVKAHVLEAKGALGEPEMLGHFFDEQGFGLGGGLVFGAQVSEEIKEVVRVFPIEDQKAVAGEAVAEGVFAGLRFALRGFWSGGELRIFAVAFGVIGWGERGRRFFRSDARSGSGRESGVRSGTIAY